MFESTRFNWGHPIRFGLIAGIIALSLCAIGMVEAFDDRDMISGVLTLGQMLLFGPAVLAGYLSAQSNAGGRQAALALLGGLIAGLHLRLPLIGADLPGQRRSNLRELGLANVSPGSALRLLTFDQGLCRRLSGPGRGDGSWWAWQARRSTSLPGRIRRPLLIALADRSLTVGMLSEIVIRVPAQARWGWPGQRSFSAARGSSSGPRSSSLS